MQRVAPRTVGDLFDESVRLYRESFGHWWLPSLACALASFALGCAIKSSIGWDRDLLTMLLAGARPSLGPALLATAVLALVTLWAYGALYAAFDAAYRAAPLTHAQAASIGVRVLPQLLGTAVVSSLIIALGFVALVVPGAYLFARLALAMPVSAIERGGVFASMSRSYALTQGSFWRISTALSIVVGITILAAIAFSIVTAILAWILGSDPIVAALIDLGLQALQTFLTTAITPIVGVVLYRDLKARLDGRTQNER
jgi:hypothetical protein